MDLQSLIEVFDCEMQCEYKGRKYIARDNGAILRFPKDGCKPSRLDNIWTFGNKDVKTGYMMFTGNVRVHQVVATAFHGAPEDPNMVVDHKDTNRCNNRPDNLQWVTRLENALNNPITRKRIIMLCGSIEAFLKDPSILRQSSSEPNTAWMRTVTKDEAAKCMKNLTRWSEQDADMKPTGKGIDERVFKDNDAFEGESWDKDWMRREYKSDYQRHMEEVEEMNRKYIEEQYGLKDSLTPRAKQLEWKTPTEFPLTPQQETATPLQDYLSRLKKGAIFSRNQYSVSPVYDAAISEDGSHLAVVTEITGVTNYALAEISFSDGVFIHKSIRTFFTEEGAIKYFTLSLGREWTGGDVMEDYC